MAAFRTGSGGRPRDFIVRTGWNMLRLESLDGKTFDLIGALRQMEQAPQPDALNQPREWTVQALYGRDKKTQRLPIRLVILPLPPGSSSGAGSGEGRDRPQQAQAKCQQAPAAARPAQRSGRRVHGAGNLIAGRDPSQ